MDWVWPLVGGLGSALTIWLSKPEKKWAAKLATLIVVTQAGWQTYTEYTTGRTKREVERRAYYQLSGENMAFMNVLSELLVRSSDGWLPNDEKEFFSARTATLLCSQLDITQRAPITPDRSLMQWLSEAGRRYRSRLNEITIEASTTLDADLVRTLTTVIDSVFLEICIQRPDVAQIDQRNGTARPPVLCWGVEPPVAQALQDIASLTRLIREGEEKYDIKRPRDWLRYPQSYRGQRLGINRFSPEMLKTWRESHPNSPGPFLYGDGPPHKQNN